MNASSVQYYGRILIYQVTYMFGFEDTIFAVKVTQQLNTLYDKFHTILQTFSFL